MAVFPPAIDDQVAMATIYVLSARTVHQFKASALPLMGGAQSLASSEAEWTIWRIGSQSRFSVKIDRKTVRRADNLIPQTTRTWQFSFSPAPADQLLLETVENGDPRMTDADQTAFALAVAAAMAA